MGEEQRENLVHVQRQLQRGDMAAHVLTAVTPERRCGGRGRGGVRRGGYGLCCQLSQMGRGAGSEGPMGTDAGISSALVATDVRQSNS